MLRRYTNYIISFNIYCIIIYFARKMLIKTVAKPGDVVVISGTFGLTLAGLEILMRDAKSAGAFRKYAVESVLEPKPRQRFGIALAKFVSSSIDSSDGLAISLYELAGQSGVNIVIDTMPAAEGVEKFAQE